MAKVTDYTVCPEVTDIMEAILKKFPTVFPGFDVNKIGCVHTASKKNPKKPIKITSVRYPYDVWIDKTYIVEVMEDTWQEMSDKQKNLAVFHIMCAIPDGAFDEQSKEYGKKKRPDYEMYAEEFAVTGGVPNWMENDEANDPLAKKGKTGRTPITEEMVTAAALKEISEVEVGSEEAEAKEEVKEEVA